MTKISRSSSAAVAAVAVLALGASGCASAAPPAGAGFGAGRGAQQTRTIATLTNSQAEALAFMVEEEKLAHDLYTLAYDTYGLAVFGNIARSETQHQSAIRRLLDRYRLPDPTSGQAPGEFVDKDLQALYDTLAAQVMESQEAALQVGVTVEKTDIADLKESRVGMPRDVKRVMDNLLRASRQHLRAFNYWVSVS